MRTILYPVLAFFALCARAAEPVTLPGTVAETIHSRVTQTTYRLSIYVPPASGVPGRRRPVIYALDGLWHFALLCQLQGDLVYGKKMPAAIVVALDYEGGIADTMRLRQRDFTPWTYAHGEGEFGGADRYLLFLETELLPRIEAEYAIDPADRTLAGHSYGGLFSLYALATRPGLFHRVLAASPSLDRRLVSYISSRVRSPASPRETRLDVSFGAEELQRYPGDAVLFQDLKQAIQANAAATHVPVVARYSVYGAQNHGSVRSVSFNYGLAWLFGTDPGDSRTLVYQAQP